MSDHNTSPIVIFGATGAVGSHLARRLHARGTPLHLVARNNESLQALSQELNAGATVCDVLEEDSLQQVYQDIASEHIGGLAFCVGSIVLKSLRSATSDDFITAYRLNVVAAAQAIRHGLRPLKKGNASIVLFSSVAASRGFHNHTVIGSAKAGVNGLTVALASELAPEIRVNAIAPSLSESAMSASLLQNDKVADNIARQHALQRLGQPDDHAAMAAYLLSPESGWITGQIFGVDGGRSNANLPG